jgi:NADPH:quinone reductase-like Zn-dependent oxidoreductase
MKANSELQTINGLAEEGRLKPVIGSCFPLEETARAFDLFQSGYQQGKIVLSRS